ncbi:MAG: hypothetical protein GY934_06010 [Gammaproteobacteria bacterium]|nr:hypothetical protein [Gammaproteobacteria bacterium]
MNRGFNNQALQTILMQLVVTVLAALILWIPGWVYAFSGLAGGIIATAANALFAAKIFARYRAQEPGKILARFYGAEVSRLLLTAMLFGAAIRWIDPLDIGALLGVFLLVHLTPVFTLHLLSNKSGF